jgi:hypothetical protein|tara:strand:- start:104 stop:325 length:222 start_codon:yes stop_codon:yes gene_type:complete
LRRYGSYIKYVNDRCFLVIREMPVHQMIIPKRHPNKIDKELLGLWVNHLGGNHVLRERDKLLICEEIEDAKVE